MGWYNCVLIDIVDSRVGFLKMTEWNSVVDASRNDDFMNIISKLPHTPRTRLRPTQPPLSQILPQQRFDNLAQRLTRMSFCDIAILFVPKDRLRNSNTDRR